MARKRIAALDLYVAAQPFTWRGVAVPAGSTAVGGHPVLAEGRRELLFRPFQPTFGSLPDPEPEAEAPTAEPEA